MLELFHEFHFIRPAGLVLLPIAVAVWWYWNRSQDPLRGWRCQMDAALMNALVVGQHSSWRARGMLTLIGWLLAAVAIAGPTWQLEPNPLAQDSASLIILLKADRSMSDSLANPSPMQRAGMKIMDLAQERTGQPLGLLAYAGSAHWVLPPTRDTQVVAQMASEIAPEVMPLAGDRLDLALEEASRFLEKSKQVGSIVVLADSVTADLKALHQWRKSNAVDVQILAIHPPGTQYHDSLANAGKALKAPVERLDSEGKDLSAIIRRASDVAKMQSGQQGDNWQEAGWWLVPFIGLVVVSLFRREVSEVL